MTFKPLRLLFASAICVVFTVATVHAAVVLPDSADKQVSKTEFFKESGDGSSVSDSSTRFGVQQAHAGFRTITSSGLLEFVKIEVSSGLFSAGDCLPKVRKPRFGRANAPCVRVFAEVLENSKVSIATGQSSLTATAAQNIKQNSIAFGRDLIGTADLRYDASTGANPMTQATYGRVKSASVPVMPLVICLLSPMGLFWSPSRAWRRRWKRRKRLWTTKRLRLRFSRFSSIPSAL